jgi:hypothetical protein
VIDMIGTSMADSVVVVAVDTGDPDIATLEEFRGRMELSLPVVWLDPEEVETLRRDLSLSDLLPVTIFLDPRGEEYLRVSGTRSEEFFREAVRAGAADIEYAGHPDSVFVLHINVGRR